jgi:hypothetical protein
LLIFACYDFIGKERGGGREGGRKRERERERERQRETERDRDRDRERERERERERRREREREREGTNFGQCSGCFLPLPETCANWQRAAKLLLIQAAAHDCVWCFASGLDCW